MQGTRTVPEQSLPKYFLFRYLAAEVPLEPELDLPEGDETHCLLNCPKYAVIELSSCMTVEKFKL
jgi:hypothetical protein